MTLLLYRVVVVKISIKKKKMKTGKRRSFSREIPGPNPRYFVKVLDLESWTIKVIRARTESLQHAV